MSAPSWSDALSARISNLVQRGGLAVTAGPLGSEDVAALHALASDSPGEFVEVHAAAAGSVPGGVCRAAAAAWLGEGSGLGDASFCEDAVGEGRGALEALDRLVAGFSRDLGPSSDSGEMPWLRGAEALARVLAEAGEVEPHVLLVRGASQADALSLHALRSLLAGRGGAGWAVVLEGPLEGTAAATSSAIARVADDERVASPWFVEVEPAGGDEVAGSLPKQGTAVELLDVLAASPVPLPAAVAGSDALSRYRGRAPRAGWVDLQGVVESGKAVLIGDTVQVSGWSPTGEGGPVARADARALAEAVAEVLPGGAPGRTAVLAALATAGGSPAGELLLEAAESALAQGDGHAAARFLDGRTDLPARRLRVRGLRVAGDAAKARTESDGSSDGELRLEFARASLEVGRLRSAKKAFEAAAAEGDDLVVGAAQVALARLNEHEGQAVAAAGSCAEAAKAFERAGRPLEAARAFALRALAISKAGAAERSIKELKQAMLRAQDPDDPHDAALEVRATIGLVFRDAGHRDKARQALALAADKAHAAASPDRETEARLMLGRFFLEGLPVQGPERGTSLREARSATEAALCLARGCGRGDLEAEAESVLGELSWRSEDWDGALSSLGRQQALWSAVGRADKEVDTAIRRSQLAGRRNAWDEAFKAANAALMLASRRRLADQSGHAQMARGEALAGLDRKDEALASFTEAHRIFSSLGEAHAVQAAASQRRARALVSGE
jgi:tetratricopeptide (TPR) repeat protein